MHMHNDSTCICSPALVSSLERAAPKAQEPIEVLGVQLRDLQHVAFANVEAGYELTRCQTLLFRRFAAADRVASLCLRV